MEKQEARAFYEAEAVKSRWSTHELERQINSLLFERLALSRDKAGILALANKGREIQQSDDLVRDPLSKAAIFKRSDPLVCWPSISCKLA